MQSKCQRMQQHAKYTENAMRSRQIASLHGDSCAFAHGHVEVEVLPDLTKTSLCLSWKAGWSQGFPDYGTLPLPHRKLFPKEAGHHICDDS